MREATAWAAAALCLASLAPGCARRESIEAARDRSSEALLVHDISDLRALIARAEAGQLVTQGRLVIGIAEETSNALLNAPLPQEKVVSNRVRVRIEKVKPFFRGNNAVLVIQATAQGVSTGTEARLELGGRLKDFRIEQGRLTTGVEIVHFKVLGESTLGDVLETLLRNNLDVLSGLIPALEVPVQLDQSIEIGGLEEGPVSTGGGVLPLQMTLAEVIPVNERLWIVVDVKAGPWGRPAAAKKDK